MTVMKKSELKISIHRSYKNNEYGSCISQLLQLAPYELSNFFNKNPWLKQQDFSEYFWTEFLSTNESKDIVFSSEHAQFFINQYLKTSHIYLDKHLVEKCPEIFIEEIRRNKIFTNGDRLNNLEKLNLSDVNYIHVFAWKELNGRTEKIQSRISNQFARIKNLSLSEFLSFLTIWIERKRFGHSTPLLLEELMSTYNYAIGKFLFQLNTIVPDEIEKFDEVFLIALKKTNPVDGLLNSILELIQFEQRILEPYCHDMNFRPILKEGVLHFEYKKVEKYDAWKLDEERYLINANRYLIEAGRYLVDGLSSGNLKIPGRTDEDIDNNKLLFIKEYQALLFLQDLQLSDLKLSKSNVELKRMLTALNSYSMNRFYRYELPMAEISKSNFLWSEVYIENIRHSHSNGITNWPFAYIYESREQFFDLFENVIMDFKSDDYEELIKFFSKDIRGEMMNFNVAETPFLQFDNFLFCPIAFFANNNWFYTIGQRGLQIIALNSEFKKRVESSRKMEEDFSKLFNYHQWNVIMPSQSEVNRIEGDIDIIVSDSESQLLIQLKRTLFRTNLLGQEKERAEVDLKAAMQINMAVEFLQEFPGEISILKKHVKWIVSTSFENVLRDFEGCKKINFFDLTWALQMKEFKNLNELVMYMESDHVLIDSKKETEHIG